MASRKMFCLLLLFCWLQLAYGARSFAEARSAGEGRSPSWEFTSGARHHFAVMGQVVHPGVYTFSTPFPPLAKLLEAAGGVIDDEASGHFYVVRHNEKGPQTLIPQRRVESGDTSESTISLRPNDVVVVEAKGQAAEKADVFREDSDSTNWMRGRQVSGSVQVALVNLIDRPVVVTLVPHRAKLVDIIVSLGQSYDIRPSVRVIQPNVSRAVANQERSGNKILASGTVLLFDRTLIRRELLPRLPATIPTERTTQPVSHVRETGKSIETDVRSIVPEPTSQKSPVEPVAEKSQTQIPLSATATVKSDTAVPLNPRARSDVPTEPMTVDTTGVLPPMDAEPAGWKEVFSSAWFLWLVCVVMLFAFVQYWKKASETKKPPHRPLARIKRQRQHAVVVVDTAEESVPKEAAVDGPAAVDYRREIGPRMIRIDAGHTVSQPHSNPETTSTGGDRLDSPKAPPSDTTEAVSPMAPTAEEDVSPRLPRVSVMDNTQPLLDRVLASVYEAARR